MRAKTVFGARVVVLWGAITVAACGESTSADAGKEPANDSGAELPDSAGAAPVTTTGTVDVDGASLYYEARGSGDVVLLLHGFTLDTRMWDHQFEALSKSYKVVRFDMRGHGKSSGARGADGGAI